MPQSSRMIRTGMVIVTRTVPEICSLNVVTQRIGMALDVDGSP